MSAPLNYLPKSRLIVGAYYYGKCRNARIARWDGEKFKHWRYKFGGVYLEEIKHPEDEARYDVFYPIEEIAEHSVKPIPKE